MISLILKLLIGSTKLAKHFHRTKDAVRRQATMLGLHKLIGKNEKRKRPIAVNHITLTQRAYLAGLIDGEGTITICKNKKAYNAHISIANTNFDMLKWVQNLLPQGTLAVAHQPTKVNKKCWIYAITGARIAPLLRALIPFLIGKRKVAKLVLKWINLRDQMFFRTAFSSEIQMIYQKIKASNARGPPLGDDNANSGITKTQKVM